MEKFNYEKFKKEAIQTQPLQYKVDLSEIDITDQGLILIKGQALRTADNVLSDLLKILGIHRGFMNKFGKTLGDESKYNLIKIIKEALVLKNSSANSERNTLTVIGNPLTGEISYILPGNRDVISNELALDLFEKSFDASGDSQIVDATYGLNNLSLTVRKNIEVPVEIDGRIIKGEEFNPGFNFKNSLLTGVSVETYMERLVCTNGMTSTGYFGDIEVKRISDTEIQNYFKNFIQLQKSGFVSNQYAKNIERAIETKASFSELTAIKNTMINNSTITEKDIHEFLPEWKKEVNRLAASNIDYTKCNSQQLQNHATKTNFWDVINRLTDFGSHDYGFFASVSSIQKVAGLLLNKTEYDIENILIL